MDKNQVHSASHCCVSEAVRGHRQHKRGSNEAAQRCVVSPAGCRRGSNLVEASAHIRHPGLPDCRLTRELIQSGQPQRSASHGGNIADRAATPSGDWWWETVQSSAQAVAHGFPREMSIGEYRLAQAGDENRRTIGSDRSGLW